MFCFFFTPPKKPAKFLNTGLVKQPCVSLCMVEAPLGKKTDECPSEDFTIHHPSGNMCHEVQQVSLEKMMFGRGSCPFGGIRNTFFQKRHVKHLGGCYWGFVKLFLANPGVLANRARYFCTLLHENENPSPTHSGNSEKNMFEV